MVETERGGGGGGATRPEHKLHDRCEPVHAAAADDGVDDGSTMLPMCVTAGARVRACASARVSFVRRCGGCDCGMAAAERGGGPRVHLTLHARLNLNQLIIFSSFGERAHTHTYKNIAL